MTSGIIRGNSLSFLKHEELSMTVQPDSFAIGANFFATSDPAEKKDVMPEVKPSALETVGSSIRCQITGFI